MTRQEKSLEKKKLGRPAIGKGLQFNAMLRPEMAAAIDAWIAAQPEPRPSRPEAIRRLLAEALGRPPDVKSPALPPASDAFLRALGHQSENAEVRVRLRKGAK